MSAKGTEVEGTEVEGTEVKPTMVKRKAVSSPDLQPKAKKICMESLKNAADNTMTLCLRCGENLRGQLAVVQNIFSEHMCTDAKDIQGLTACISIILNAISSTTDTQTMNPDNGEFHLSMFNKFFGTINCLLRKYLQTLSFLVHSGCDCFSISSHTEFKRMNINENISKIEISHSNH